MIELFEKDIRDEKNSSKGNQLKWKTGSTWYKSDYLGYEGLSEYICSHILMESTLDKGEFVLYDTETIKYKETFFTGCKSSDFLPKGWQLITAERLIKQQTGQSIGAGLYGIENHKERLRFLVDQVELATGISDFGSYMSTLLTIDALFLNEDRHTHNIALLLSPDGCFHKCPVFDNGAALLSDTRMDYPIGADTYELMDTARSKTFCDDFCESMEIAEELYGNNVKFGYDWNQVAELIEADSIYGKNEKERVMTVLMEQKRRYPYLFEKK